MLDNELMTYFKKEKDVQFKKHIPIANARVKVEGASEVEGNKSKHSKWHDKKYDYRVVMELETRKY